MAEAHDAHDLVGRARQQHRARQALDLRGGVIAVYRQGFTVGQGVLLPDDALQFFYE